MWVIPHIFHPSQRVCGSFWKSFEMKRWKFRGKLNVVKCMLIIPGLKIYIVIAVLLYIIMWIYLTKHFILVCIFSTVNTFFKYIYQAGVWPIISSRSAHWISSDQEKQWCCIEFIVRLLASLKELKTSPSSKALSLASYTPSLNEF